MLHKALPSPLVGLLQKLIPAGKGVWDSRDTAPASLTHRVGSRVLGPIRAPLRSVLFFSWNSLSSAVTWVFTLIMHS